MKMHIIKRALRQNQEGLASFIVVFSMMLIISLMVLTFANVVRNEQRQTLDRQLSSRAFYAAESGVNIAREALANNQFVSGKLNCDPEGSLTAADYNAGDGTAVTCLIINTSPTTLLKELGVDETWIVPLNGGGALNGLNINWENTAATNSTSYVGVNCSGTTLRAFSAWTCPAPLLRIDIVQTSGSMNIGTLNSSLATFFLYPNNGAVGSLTHSIALGSGNNKGAIVPARCHANNVPKDCRLQINGMTGQNYYVRIMSLYQPARIELSADSGTTLRGAQAVVDSTGRSVDILRRIQVRLPLTNSEGVPSFGLFGAAGICKRYQIMPPNTVTIDGGEPGLCGIN